MEIRRYQDGDEAGIQTLFREVFGKERPIEEWEWKFRSPSSTQVPFVLVAEHEGKIVGHVGCTIVQMKYGAHLIRAGARVDTMVSPSARGQGLYQKLNTRLLQEADKEGIQMLYGYPAQKAHELLTKQLDAFTVGNIPRWVRLQRVDRLIASRVPAFRGVARLLFSPLRFVGSGSMKRASQVESVTECDARFTELAHCSSMKVGLIRDKDYLNWRYHQHPTKQYNMRAIEDDKGLFGYVVSYEEERNGMRVGHIVDLVIRGQDRQKEDDLFSAVLYDLRKADLVQTWAHPEMTSVQVLRRWKFLQKDAPMPLVLLSNHFTKEEMEADAHLSRWTVAQGDVDSF